MQITVRQAIKELRKMNQDAVVKIEYEGSGGCGTCGYGNEATSDAEKIVDLETSVVFSAIL